MPEFTYQALDARKQFTTGQLHAVSMSAAVEQLTKLGYIPLSTKPSVVARGSAWKKLLQPRVTQREVTILLQDLAVLLHSGLPLDDALKLQADNASAGMTRLLHQLRNEVESGGNFADALNSHPATASPELVAIVKSAEAAGDLEHALRPLSEERAKQEMLTAKISAAVRYPIFLLVVAIGVLVFFLLFVVPQFADAVRDIGGHTDSSVMTVIAISDYLQANGSLIGIVGLTLAGAALLAFWHPRSRNQLIAFFSKLPGIRGIVVLRRTTNFCRGLGMLLSNGVTLTDALRLLSEAQIGGNHLKLIADHIRRGGRLVDAIAETNFLPPLAARMLRVGEETGSLDVAAKRCAEYYQTKLTERIDKLANIVGPAAIVVISTVVGTLIVSIMSTLLSINQMAL
jgi:general secretion pathway protein F